MSAVKCAEPEKLSNSNEKARPLLEHSSERISRLKREEADARLHRLEKLLPIGLVSLLVLCAVAVYLVVMLSGNYGAEDKDRAEKVLTPIITGLLGYFSGRAKRNNKAGAGE